jgi:SAM-dependent methyltransferase
MNDSAEVSRIKDSYDRRHAIYDPCSAWVYQTRLELERALIETLRRAQMLPLTDRSLLEVGCGSGNNLLLFLRLGIEPERLVGNELLEQRASEAQRRVPAATRILCGDALQTDFGSATFDIVYQSLVFSSILDARFQQELAQRMWEAVRPGGGVLWYDFTYDNPRNPDVAGVPIARVRQLFPQARLACRRVTLAPPLSRVVTRWHAALYPVFNSIPWLRTHVVCWLGKPSG